MANHTTVGEALGLEPPSFVSSFEGFSEDITDSSVTPGLISEYLDKVDLCPSIPGIEFPALPNIALVGELVGKLTKGIANASLLMIRKKPFVMPAITWDFEFASGASSLFDKVKQLALSASRDAIKAAQKELAEQWDELKKNPIVETMMALDSAEGWSELGHDVMALPASMLDGAFEGFDSAVECLDGIADGAVALFKEKSKELKKGYAAGRGKNDIEERVKENFVEGVDENGSSVVRVVQQEESQFDALGFLVDTGLSSSVLEGLLPAQLIDISDLFDNLSEEEIFDFEHELNIIAESSSSSVLSRHYQDAIDLARSDASLPPLYLSVPSKFEPGPLEDIDQFVNPPGRPNVGQLEHAYIVTAGVFHDEEFAKEKLLGLIDQGGYDGVLRTAVVDGTVVFELRIGPYETYRGAEKAAEDLGDDFGLSTGVLLVPGAARRARRSEE